MQQVKKPKKPLIFCLLCCPSCDGAAKYNRSSVIIKDTD